MPYKHHADRRHHIPKMLFKVRNWPAYEAGLRRRGSFAAHSDDCSHRFRSKPAICSERSQPGIPMIPAG